MKIKMTESKLRGIISECVKNVLNEIGDTEKGQEALGALHARKVYNNARDSYKKTGKLAHDPSDDEKEIYNYAEKRRKKSGEGDNGKMKRAYDSGYVKQRDKENAMGIDKIVKESIKRVLKESYPIGIETDFDKINYDLSQYGDVKLIKQESDGKHLVLSIPKTVDAYTMTEIGKYLRTMWGYHVYDVGESGNYKVVTLVKKDRDQAQMDDDFDEYAKSYL